MNKILSFLMVLLVFAGCKKDEIPTPAEPMLEEAFPLALSADGGIDNQSAAEAKQIVLGKRLKNAYSVDNMRAAFAYYNRHVENSEFKDKIVTPTHHYIKILPTTEAHLALLDELDNNANSEDMVLHDYPLDYEILEEGDYYITPQNETDLYHPVYTVIPVDYDLPGGLPFQLIEKLYEPLEDEYNVETASLVLSGWTQDIVADFGKKITEKELPDFLNNSEHSEERLFGRRYRPHGWVKVENTQTNIMDPLKRAKISIGRSIWWRYTDTDDSGHFNSPKKYRGTVRIRAKWRSHSATIRTSWNEMLGIQVSDHLMTITRGSNGRIKHIMQPSEHLWYKGTVHNGIIQYNIYSALLGIDKQVVGANVWVWKNGEDASTPMLNKYRNLPQLAAIAGLSQSNFWGIMTTTMVGIVGQGIQLLFGHLMPDHIYAGLKSKTHNGEVNTARIHQLVFHESGHYSHASKAGASNWANVFASELNNIVVHGHPYHDGASPTFADGEHIALAEGWASYIEHSTVMWSYLRYWDGDNLFTGSTAVNYLENFNMYTTPMTLPRDDNDSWFLSGLMWDIADNATDVNNNTRLLNGTTGATMNVIVDNVSGIGTAPIFNSLTSGTRSMCDLKSRLTSIVGGSTAIDDLFESYGCDDGNGCFLFAVTARENLPQERVTSVLSRTENFYAFRDDFLTESATGIRYLNDFYELGELVATRKVNLSLSTSIDILDMIWNHQDKIELLTNAAQNGDQVLYSLDEAKIYTVFVKELKAESSDAQWNAALDKVLADIKKYKGMKINDIVASL